MTMSFNKNVCRLCLSEKDLVWVFENHADKTEDLHKVILITTGVEILEKDVISQKICGNCRKVTVKMFEFRERSVKTDKYLKEQCAEFLKEKRLKIPHTDVVITTGKKTVQTTFNENCKLQFPKNEKIAETKPNNETATDTKSDVCKKLKIHPTVSDIFTTYPNIKLPTGVLRFDVGPSVCMELDAVEGYCARSNLDMNKAVQKALRSSRATKKTSPSNKHKGISQEKLQTNKPSENSTAIDTTKNIVPEDKFLKPTPGTSCASEERCVEDRRVSPISIKLVDSKSVFKVVSKENLTRKIDDNDSHETIKMTDKPSKLKRRRLSSSDLSSETETTHPTLMETLELKPKENIHRCSICKSVQKTAKSLKKHVQEHFRCNFCRAKFRLVERKETHENECVVKHILGSRAYVKLDRIDWDLRAVAKYPALDFITSEAATADKNITSQILVDIPKTGDVCHEIPVVEIIELSDDEEQDINNSDLSTSLPSTSKTVMSTPTANSEVKIIEPESRINIPVPPANVSADMPPKPIDLSNFNSKSTSTEYCSASVIRPDIKIKDNFVLNGVDVSAPDGIVLKHLLTTTNTSADFKMSVDGEMQTELPTNDQIVKNNATSTADLKSLLPHLFVFKVPVSIQKGDFNVGYIKNIPQKPKSKHLWSGLKPVDLKSSNGYVKPNLNKTKVQGKILLNLSKKDISHAPAAVYNPNSGTILYNGQKHNSVTPATHQTIQNIKQSTSMHKPENRRPHLSEATTSQVASPAPIVLNKKFAQPAVYSNTTSKTSQNAYYVQPTVAIVTNNNTQLVSTPGTNTALTKISQHQTHLPQTMLTNNNIQSYTTTSIPSNPVCNQQSLNVSLSYTSNLNSALHSLPSLPNDTVVSTLVLPSCNTLSGTIPQPNVNPFSDKGIFCENLAQNDYSALVVSAASNDFTNALTSSIGQNSAPSTSGISNVNNAAHRPMIRVRNICELK